MGCNPGYKLNHASQVTVTFTCGLDGKFYFLDENGQTSHQIDCLPQDCDPPAMDYADTGAKCQAVTGTAAANRQLCTEAVYEPQCFAGMVTGQTCFSSCNEGYQPKLRKSGCNEALPSTTNPAYPPWDQHTNVQCKKELTCTGSDAFLLPGTITWKETEPGTPEPARILQDCKPNRCESGRRTFGPADPRAWEGCDELDTDLNHDPGTKGWVTMDVCTVGCIAGFSGQAGNWKCARNGRGEPMEYFPNANYSLPLAELWLQTYPTCVAQKCNKGFPDPTIPGLDVSTCGDVRTNQYCRMRCLPGYTDSEVLQYKPKPLADFSHLPPDANIYDPVIAAYAGGRPANVLLVHNSLLSRVDAVSISGNHNPFLKQDRVGEDCLKKGADHCAGRLYKCNSRWVPSNPESCVSGVAPADRAAEITKQGCGDQVIDWRVCKTETCGTICGTAFDAGLWYACDDKKEGYIIAPEELGEHML